MCFLMNRSISQVQNNHLIILRLRYSTMTVITKVFIVFVNNVNTQGGTHVAGLRSALTRSVNNFVQQYMHKESQRSISRRHYLISEKALWLLLVLRYKIHSLKDRPSKKIRKQLKLKDL